MSGSPSIVLNKNGIDDTQLKKNNLDVSDLVESLRGAGYFSLDAVDYALYEANGSFSALPKAEYADMQSSLPDHFDRRGQIRREKSSELTKRSKAVLFSTF